MRSHNWVAYLQAFYFLRIDQSHVHFTIPNGFNPIDLNHKDKNLLLNNH